MIDHPSTETMQQWYNHTAFCTLLRGLLAVLIGIMLWQADSVQAAEAPDEKVVFVTALSGAAEVPGPGDPDGSGSATITVDSDTNEVCYTLSFSDIAAPSAGHIHIGAADESGGVLIGLFSDTADAAAGCVSDVPADDLSSLLANPAGHYVNIHNADFAPGAIRGQLSAPATVLTATLTGAAEVPGPGDDDGSGSATISVDAAAGILCYEITVADIDTPTAGHIHTGAADTSGDVLIGLFADAAGLNSGCVTDVSADDIIILLGEPAGHYVNIHNAEFPAGAVRGQLVASGPTMTTVTVAHFAPFADTVVGTSVSVRINGNDAVTNVEFGNIIPDLSLLPGEYTIEIVPTGTSTVAISATVALTAGIDYTVAAIGNGTGQPLELFPMVDDNAAPATAGNAKIRIAHLAPFADTLAGTQVNICTDAGIAVISDVPYKAFTDPYLELPAGDYDLKVVPAADGCGAAALDLPAVSLAAGSVADVFAIGDITNQPLQIASTTGLQVVAAPTGLDNPSEEPMNNLLFLPIIDLQ